MTPDSSLLVALAQPCIGAFIGYLTNKIAIRMLFRPLRPWHVLGWRVPLTPGIIPSKRHELAASIGEMVGMRLLTSEEIGRAISGEAFQEHLNSLVARQLDAFCQKELPSLQGLFPAGSETALLSVQNQLIREAQEALSRYLASPNAIAQLSAWLESAGKKAEGEQADATILRELAENLLAQMLASGGERIGGMLAAMLEQAAAEEKQLRDLVPAALIRQLHNLVEAQSPRILERIGQQILAPEARPSLVNALITVVHQLLESLGPMGAMARGFFEADTFSRKINEYLDKNGPAIAAWLNSPELQQRLALVLQESVDNLFDKKVAELLNGLEPGQLEAVCHATGSHIAAALQSEAAKAALAQAMGDILQRFLQSLPAAGQGTSPAASPASLLLDFLRSGKGRSLLQAGVETLIQGIFALPLGMLAPRIPQAFREVLGARLVRQANLLFLHELPALVQVLNIKELVSDKVDSLDLLQLERLLLGIMEEQFKYINLFGALLGFLIGLVNLLLFQLR